MKEYIVNITINGVVNQGKIILDDNSFLLQVSGQEKKIFYSNVNECYINNSNKVVIILKDSIVIELDGENYNEIVDFIHSNIVNNSKNDNLSNPVLHIFIGLFLNFLPALYRRNPILYLISFIGLLLVTVSIFRIIISIIKKFGDSAYNKEHRNSFLCKFVSIILPLFFLIVTIVYHSTGPEGASNAATDSFLASCKNQGKTLGITTYTCYSGGRKCVATCDDKECAAVCGR